MKPTTLVARLSPGERAVVPHLTDGMTVESLATAADMQLVEVMRACQFLSNKGALTLEKAKTIQVLLTPLGAHALQHGLPEERFLAVLETPKPLERIAKDAKLSKDEVNASIGILKNAGAIVLGKDVEKLKDVSFREKHVALQAVKDGKGIPDDELLKRGLIETRERSTHRITRTNIGKELQNADLSTAYEERLTHEMLKSGAWKDKQFRHYDVTTNVPSITYGRVHFISEAIETIKDIWIEMGFQEMTGTMTQTAFKDLDILFVPQDHPAREMQDTFYLPYRGDLPEWWTDIKAVHEHGGDTGSTGWQAPYSEEEARKVLMRTHTTVLSAMTLKQLQPEDLPAKFFSVSRVFRNETLDWKHLAEFHQVEGIVVAEGLTIADLIGLQKEFYRKMGFTEIRFRPAYFPYTEPSAEVEVYHPGKQQWIELGGMGVFRPEVVQPLLGKDVAVLAWGLGMERIVTDFFDIHDLRQLYANDLAQLRTIQRFRRTQ